MNLPFSVNTGDFVYNREIAGFSKWALLYAVIYVTDLFEH